jgi:VCBS repeat-containing protein
LIAQGFMATNKDKVSKSAIAAPSDDFKLHHGVRAAHNIVALEQRIAFDGALAPTFEAMQYEQFGDQLHRNASLEIPVADNISAEKAVELASAVNNIDAAFLKLVETTGASVAQATSEIVFIDARVEDAAQLLSGIRPGVEVVLLDASRDGIGQIASVLQGRHDISAIHILSHGSEGRLLLGSGEVNSQTINGAYAADLAQIGAALTLDADILVYGCDFAKGNDGKLAAESLARLTGADVAASDNATGSVTLGGDWNLEEIVGTVDTSRELTALDWNGLLATTTINASGGVNTTGADGLKIVVSDLGQLQVFYQNGNQFYTGGGVEGVNLFNGMYLRVGTQVVGPDTGAENITTKVPWKSIGTQTTSGTGTLLDPYLVKTSVYYDAGVIGPYDALVDIKVEITTSYIFPNKYFTQNIVITPPAGNTQDIKFYHAIDTFLGGADTGPAFSLNPDLALTGNTTGDPSFVGVRRGVGTASEAIVGFAELDGGAQFNRYYSAVWNGANLYGNGIGSASGDIVNTWDINTGTDNGIGVQFNIGTITSPASLNYYIAFDGDTKLDLDANNSTASGTSYVGSFSAATGSQISVVDSDVVITNVIGDINYAKVTLTTPQAGDILTVDVTLLPTGVTVEAVTATSVSFSGIATETAYQSVLQLVKFSTTSGTTTNRSFTVEVRNQLNSITTTASSSLIGALSPVVDLNSGTTGFNSTANTVSNPGFSDLADVPNNWTEGGTGAATNTGYTGRYGFTNTSADTLTQTGLGGLRTGPSPSGAGQLTLDIGWVNGDGSTRTFTIQVGGVTYATLTTGAAAAAAGSIAYQNGATNSAGTTTATALNAMATSTSALTSITINLPISVATSGSLVFSGSSNADDIYIDNVKILTTTTAILDATSGTDFSTIFSQNGTAVSISDTDNDVRDGDSANMASGLVTLTNPQSGDRLRVAGSIAVSGTIGGISYTNSGTSVALTGSATKAAYAAAIQAITFEHTTGSAATGVIRDITVTVNDGAQVSNTAHSYITVVDSPPVIDLDANDSTVSGTGFATTFTENGAAVAIADVDTSVSDSNDTNMESATVTLGNPQVGDRLLVNGSFAASGTLASGIAWTRSDSLVTLSGSFTKAQYAAALQLVQFENTTDAPATVDRLIAVKVNDGSTDSNVATAVIHVIAVNDAPVLAVSSTGSFIENGSVAVNPLITVVDVDSAGLSFATVSITNFVIGQDVLSFTNVPATMGNITAGYNTTTGVLTLNSASNSATPAQWQTALRAVMYSNSSDAPNTATRNFSIQISDGQAISPLSNIVTSTLTVTAVNDAPQGTDRTITINEDMPYILTAADFGFSDPLDAGADSFTKVMISTLPASGVLRLSGVAVLAGDIINVASLPFLVWTPPANGNGIALASLQFRVMDSGGTLNGGVDTDTSPNTLTFNVSAVNDAPVNTLPGLGWTVVEDSAGLTLSGLSITDVDVASGAMSITLSVDFGILQATSGGSVIVSGSGSTSIVLTGTLANLNTYLGGASTPRFVPGANFNGTVTLTMLTDDGGNTGSGGALNDSDTRTITVTAVNDAPVNTLPGSGWTTAKNIGVQLSGLSIADIDAASGAITVTLGVGSGTLSAVTGGGVTISGSGSASLTLSGTLAAINTYLAGVSAPVFAPALNATSTVTLTMTTNDGGNTGTGGALTDIDTRTIIIDPPVAANDAFITPHDTAVVVDARFNDTDAQGAVTITKVNGAAITVGGGGIAVTGGTVTLNAAGKLVFTPSAAYLGATSFTYTITDSDGNSSTATVNGTINNTAPVVSVSNSTNLLVNGDFESPAVAPLNQNNLQGTSWGGWTSTSSINVIHVNGAGYVDGADTANSGVQYIDLAGGPAPLSQSFTLAIANTISFGAEFSNRASSIGGYVIPVGYVDILNSVGTVVATSNPVALIKNYGDEVWFPSGGSVALAAGTYTYRITLGDYGHVDSAYVRTTNNAITYTENTAAVSIANAMDGVFDRDDASVKSGTVTLTNSQTGDRLLVNGSAAASGVLASGIAWTRTDTLVTFTGTATKADYAIAIRAVQFDNTTDTPAGPARIINTVVSDGTANSNTAVTTVTINSAPDPVADSFSGNEDTAISGNVLSNDTDLGDTPITSVTVTTAPLNGVMTSFNTTTGAFVYTPNGNFYGADSFVYTVTDANGDTKTATVSLTITAVNDAPVLAIALADQSSLEDQAISFTLPSGSFTDVDSTLSYSATLTGGAALPSWLVFNAGTRQFTGTPPANFNGVLDITVTASDGVLNASDAFLLTIQSVNDVPSGADKTVTVNEDTTYSFSAADFGFSDTSDSPANALLRVQITLLPVTGSLKLSGAAVLAGDWITTANIPNLSWTPAANANGVGLASLKFAVQDDGGTTNGGVDTDATPNTITFNVTAINDAPVNTLPGAGWTTAEDSPGLTLTGLSIADVDASGGTMTVTLSVSSGSLLASAGGSVTVTGSGGSSIVLTGTLANLNSYLSGAFTPQFVPVANFNGTVTLTMLTSDGGNTGAGGTLTDSDMQTITVTPVNDAPVLSAPIPDQSIFEDQAVSYTLPAGTFTDIDSALTYTATLSDNSALPSWLSFNVSTRQFTGTPPANFNGVLDIKVIASDGQYNISDTFLLTIQPVNDAPAGTDKTITLNEDSTYGFTVADFGFTDPNDTPANTLLRVKITTLPASGSLKLSGVAVAAGDWITAANIVNLSWTPAANANGTTLASLRFAVQDDGGTANGGLDTDATPNTITFNVSPVNDAPTISAPVTLNGTEDTALTITGLSFADIDASSGSVKITLTLPAGQGTFGWVATGFISATGVGSNTLTLSGQLTALNNALALGKLSVNPALDINGTVVLSIGINDNGNTGSGGPLTAATSTNLVFAAVNDAPVLAASLIDRTSLEDQSLNFTLPVGSFTDVDSTLTYSATLNGGGALPSWLVFNAATRQFTGTPPVNYNGVIDITVTASDGALSVSDSFLLTIQPVNDAPTGSDRTVTLNEDTSYVFAASDFGFTDTSDTPANTLLQVRVDTLPATGTLKLSGTAVAAGDWISTANIANLTWTPLADANGPALASFTFSVRDNGGTANGGADTDTVPNRITFNVTPVNDAPVAPVLSPVASTDSSTLSINAAFADIDSPVLNYSASGLPAGLSVNPLTGLITGTLGTSASQGGVGGVYAITLTANDGSGGIAMASFNLTVTNPLPTPGNDAFTTNEDVPFTGSLILNDSDPDGDSFSVQLVPLVVPVKGTVVLRADGTFTYTPNLNANGSDSFTYAITDADGASTSATVTMTITPVNDVPDATPLVAVASIDSETISINLGAGFSDVDGDTLSFAISGLPAGLGFNPATGVVTGTVDHRASQGGLGGVYTVSVAADDGHGGLTIRSFNWTISNPAPIAKNDALGTDQNTSTAGSVFASNGSGADTDPDGDTLGVSAVNGTAGNVGAVVAGSNGGTFKINANGSYSFDPGTDFIDVPVGQTRNTTITYTISDGDGGFATATVTVSVLGINDPPTANPIGAQVGQDSDAVSFNIAPFFRDPDYDPLTFSQTGLPAGLSINSSTGLISGVINHSASQGGTGGVYAITVTASDGHGGVISQNFNWSVTNPTPTAVNDTITVNEDTPVTINVLANDIDPDLDPLTIIATGPNAPVAGNGSVSIVAGKLVYTPNANFNGTDTIIYSISDGDGGFSTAQVTITVTPVNDAPVSTLIPDQRNNIGNIVSFSAGDFFDDVDKNDVGSTETLNFTVANLPAGLMFNPVTGRISGTVDPTATAGNPYTVTMTATDSKGATSTRSFVWQVYNDVPVAVNDAVSTLEDTAKTFNVLDGTASGGSPDYDPEAYPLTVINASAGNGTVVFNAVTGVVTYTPNANFNGVDTIVYTVQDNGGNQATGYVTVTVTPVNDAPFATVANLPNIANADSDNVSLMFGSFFDDIDLQDTASTEKLVFNVTGLPPGLVMNALTGAITGMIDHSASGPTGSMIYATTITVRDTNNTGLSVSKAFNWAVTNPSPFANNDSFTTAEDTAKTISVLANDGDPDADPLTIDLVSAGHGSIVVNANGSLTYTPDADFNGTDTIIYRVSDGNNGYATASVAVTVTAVNDAPTSTVIGNQTAQDATSVSFSARSFFDDVDLNDQVPDTLAFSAIGLPRGLAINANTGAITGALAHNVSQDRPGGVHTVTVTATDGAGLTSFRSFSWTVLNPPPVALADSATGNEDTLITGVLTNDSDPDGDALVYDTIPVTAPLHGTVTITATGSYSYQPDTNFNGTDTFTYRVSDGEGGFATAVVTIMVLPVNDAPVAGNDTATAPEDTRVTITVLGNDIDVDGDVLSVTSAAASNGTVTILANGKLDYMPNANFNGTDTITYTISDGQGGTSTATVTVTVMPMNDAPVAVADSVSTLEDTAVTIAVLANDTDVDGDALTVTSASATHGTVSISAGGVLTFTPDLNYNGPASITYAISDGIGGTSMTTVAVTVIAVNDAPVAVSPAVTTAEDTSVTGAITVSDVDGGAPIFVVSTPPLHGSVNVNMDGTYTYFPDTNFNGSDSFVVTVSDGNGGVITVTVPVTITAVNDAPVVAMPAPDRFSAEDQPFSFIVPLATFFDIDGPALIMTATLASGAPLPNWISFDAATGSFTGTPPQDYNGILDIKVIGSDGFLSAGNSFRLTITPVNDAPVAQNATVTTPEDTSLSGMLPVATDVDGDALTYAVGGTAPAHGTLMVNADGTYVYTPVLNYNGPDSFSYIVSDGMITVEKTVTITVTPENDAPVAFSDSVTMPEDTAINIAVLANDIDVDGDALTITAIDGVAITVGGSVAITGGSVTLNADGTLTFTPVADYNGAPTFTYGISDGHGGSATGSVALNVTPVNDTPVLAVAVPDVMSPEDQPFSFTLANGTFTDIDSPSLVLTATLANGAVLPSWLIFDAATRTFSGTPPQDFNGPVDIKVIASDGTLSANDTFRLTITPVNDTPVAQNHSFTTIEDTSFAGTLPIAVDVDGDVLTYAQGSTVPAHGTVTVYPDGSFSYVPEPDYHGSDSFSYIVTDGIFQVERTVNVTVASVNDLPVAVNDFTSTDPLVTISGSVLINDYDIKDGDALSVISANGTALAGASITVTGSNGGRLTIAPDGQYTFDPNNEFNTLPPGVYVSTGFTYTISDGHGGTATASLTVTVPGVNDPPNAVADIVTTLEDTVLTFDPRLNDTDPELNALVITKINGQDISVGSPVTVAGGTIAFKTDGRLTFVPNANFSGQVNLTYTVFDQVDGYATAAIRINVTPVNDAPVVVTPPLDRVVLEEQPFSFALPSNTFVDVDSGILTLSATLANGSSLPGWIVFDPVLRTFSGTPPVDFAGVLDIKVSASDGMLAASDHFLLTVTGINDAPTGSDRTILAVEDTAYIFSNADFGFSDARDLPANSLRAVTIETLPTIGRLFLGNVPVVAGQIIVAADLGRLTWTPPANANGLALASFTFRVQDDGGTANGGRDAALVRNTITLNVAPVNDAPTASASPLAMLQDTSATGSVTGRDIDGDALSYVVSVAPAHGTITLNANGTYIYAPSAGFSGNDSFSVMVSDGHGGFVTVEVPVAIRAVAKPVEPPIVPPVEPPPILPDPPIVEGEPQPQPNFVPGTESSGQQDSALAQFATDQPPTDIAFRTISATGVIIEATNAISDLNGAFATRDADRPLLAAINGISSLNGNMELGQGGRIVAPASVGLEGGRGINAIASFSTAATGVGDYLGAPTSQRSLSQFGTTLTIGSTMRVDAILTKADAAITLNLREYGVVPNDLCRFWLDVRQSDDTPLPDWLTHVRDGEFTGIPPDHLASIALKISIRLDDGTTVIRHITLDLADGKVASLAARDHAHMDDALFSQQLAGEMRGLTGSVVILSQASSLDAAVLQSLL